MRIELEALGLNKNNSVVIGSGILQALGIRKSNDIDLVVTPNVYKKLKGFDDPKYEIGTYWDVLGKKKKYADLLEESIVIEEVRYISLDFLFKVKKSWAEKMSARPKDLKDIELIESYLEL